MKIHNLYLIRKIATYFLVTFSILVLLIWFAKTVVLIRFITDKGVSITDFLNLFVLILPWLSLIIIPVSIFIAVLAAYTHLIGHNEIVVLRNAGLSSISLAKPAILLASIFCILCYFISFFFMPYANKKLRTIRFDFEHHYANLLISPGIFENLNNLTIYVKNRDASNHLSGILIYDGRNPDYSTTVTSEDGTLDQNDNSILLYLKIGTVQKFNYETGKSEILHFDSYVVNLNNDQTSSSFEWKASERYIGELLNPEQNSSPKALTEYYVELQQRIVYPLLSLVLTLIACAFILTGKFHRHGNLTHNVTAIFVAASFIGLLMFFCGIIGESPQYTSLIYLNLLLFITISFWMLRTNKRRL